MTESKWREGRWREKEKLTEMTERGKVRGRLKHKKQGTAREVERK